MPNIQIRLYDWNKQITKKKEHQNQISNKSSIEGRNWKEGQLNKWHKKPSKSNSNKIKRKGITFYKRKILRMRL
jgi:hypothetical protein